MASQQGRFVWYELMTTDTAAAERFYREVVGWSAADAGMPDMAYTILSAGEAPVGGLMALPAEVAAAGGQPGWIGYIAVDDAEAMAERAKAAGGAVHRAPEDTPGIGRFAVIGDPHGAVFALFQATDGGEGPPAAPMGTPGHVGWRELMAGDLDSAFTFYAGLFGWTKAEAHDMGPMGVYQLFATGGETAGGMMTKPAEVPAPYWGYYFNVPEIEAAAARVKAAGGQLINGPMEVPGGSWVMQGLDPQGALFALVAPPKG
ncbi:VOC family protein [Marinibaculum pumilum]|uniref:VOC family protein n=1 Tax=Marinibaculum pumilum TaxID=1766165 RepID=A0ABV7KYL0_9PROT